MIKRFALALALLGASLMNVAASAPPDRVAPDKPPLYTTTSYYMDTAESARLGSLGCAAGKRTVGLPDSQDDLIVLMFGAPMMRNGLEGANLYETGASSVDFASTTGIESGAKAFVDGYLECAAKSARLNLVLGTSNWGDHVTKGHGVAWGGMVKNVAAWLAGTSLARRASVFGGSDIEADWSKPAPARAWVDGYLSAGAPTLYNFGDAGGCPTKDDAAPTCSNGWTQEDVWYVSWGSGGRAPLPQIYNAVYVKQWYQIKRYSLTRVKDGYRPMVIAGVMTMDGDCRQAGGCDPAFAFKPAEGYGRLYDLLNAHPETAQALRYSTDIRKAWLP